MKLLSVIEPILFCDRPYENNGLSRFVPFVECTVWASNAVGANARWSTVGYSVGKGENFWTFYDEIAF